MNSRYCHSDNSETYRGDHTTIAGALAEALDEYEDAEVIQIGEATQPTIGSILNDHHVESLLDGLQETAGEEFGEYTEGWLDTPKLKYWDRTSGETHEQYNTRHAEWRRKRSERIASLREDIATALEKWATEGGEQPGFFSVKNAQDYTRGEAEAIVAAEGHLDAKGCHSAAMA